MWLLPRILNRLCRNDVIIRTTVSLSTKLATHVWIKATRLVRRRSPCRREVERSLGSQEGEWKTKSTPKTARAPYLRRPTSEGCLGILSTKDLKRAGQLSYSLPTAYALLSSARTQRIPLFLLHIDIYCD